MAVLSISVTWMHHLRGKHGLDHGLSAVVIITSGSVPGIVAQYQPLQRVSLGLDYLPSVVSSIIARIFKT